ncbi:MAG TPA: hypothetical protein VF749_02590, partial [Candidatus Acidoferrum sp.]
MSFVEWLANGAAKDAREQNQIKLDYSGLHEQYAKDRSTIGVQGLGPAYGACIGEVLRRSEPSATMR